MINHVFLIGNGSLNKVCNASNVIFCNSAFLRSSEKLNINAVITDGLLQTDEELLYAKSMKGKSTDESFEIRSAKRDALAEYKFSNLIILTNDRNKSMKQIKRMHVSCDELGILSRRKTSLLILYFLFRYRKFNKRLFSLFSWTILGYITNRKVPVRYRPSTGVIAILYFAMSGRVITLDGIGTGLAAFYPHAKGDLRREVYNNVHQFVDEIVISTLKKEGVIIAD